MFSRIFQMNDMKKKYKLTYKKIADVMGVHKDTAYKYCTGKRTITEDKWQLFVQFVDNLVKSE